MYMYGGASNENLFVDDKKKKRMFIVWFIPPVMATEWLWEAQGIYKEPHQTSTHKWDTGGSFHLQRHGKEQTSWVMCLKDTQLLTAIKTEPVRANPLGVTLDY